MPGQAVQSIDPKIGEDADAVEQHAHDVAAEQRLLDFRAFGGRGIGNAPIGDTNVISLDDDMTNL